MKVFKQENMITGYLYFYIHFITEIACFYYLTKLVGNSAYLWFAPLLYDFLAFVPQTLIGYISDKKNKISFAIMGMLLLLLSYILLYFGFEGKYIGLIILCLGNACIHVNGAEVTLKTSQGKLSHPAIFVAGGSFGVITGKLLGKINFPSILIMILILTTIPFILLAEEYKKETAKTNLKKYNYAKNNINPLIIILAMVIVVIVRGYMGYGIPTSWNKTTIQTILLFTFMGIGKALGGIISDYIGVKKTAILSTTLALPFLVFGDKIMIISLIGVMLFSMTMSITLAILVSVLNETPGLAFGLTTLGLFLGTIPIFIFKFTTVLSNSIIIIFLTIICLLIMIKTIKDDNNV